MTAPATERKADLDAAYDLVRFFATFDPTAVPDDVAERTKHYIMDCFGVGLAAVRAPGTAEVVAQVAQWGGPAESTLWAGGGKAPAFLASLVNAQMARALDFDDVFERSINHVTCAVLPVAMAMAELTGRRDGRTLIGAVAAGRDLICRLGVANLNVDVERGRSMTYQFNAFAAAAVAGIYLGLDADRMHSALGLVYGQGLSARQGVIEGKHTPRFHTGLAAQLGVQSAQLAARGLLGPRSFLEGKYGYFPLYEEGRYDRDALLDGLGTTFLGTDSSIKRFPICKQGHTAIEAAIAARRELRVGAAEEIASVHVGLNLDAYYTIYEPVGVRRRPRTPPEVQFSLPWSVAVATARGAVTLADLYPDQVRDAPIAALADRTTCEIDEEIEAEWGGRITPAWVRVELRDGRQARRRVDQPPGSAPSPLTWSEVEEKFRACLAWAGGRGTEAGHDGAVDALVGQLARLEEVADVGDLAATGAQAVHG